MYILELLDTGYLDRYTKFPKGASLVKVQKKQAINPRVIEIDHSNHLKYILKLNDIEY